MNPSEPKVDAPARTELAVWGDPIGHSRSPALHSTAYGLLGLDWHYGRRRVDEQSFGDALSGLDDSWRGLSLTMPLKEVAHARADEHDRHAALTGAVNTLLLGPTLRGFNTDVGGIVDAFAHAGVTRIDRARILGAGSTAASALVALHDLGATRVDVRARRPEAAGRLREIASALGIALSVQGFEYAASDVDATVATLPSGTVLDTDVVTPLAAVGGALFEAAYAPWPSALAAQWPGTNVISGFEMLLYQAVRQIRIFRYGSQEHLLPDEDVIVAAMRSRAMED
ncbi:shikimate dehydrogenase [Microbacterium esteraromaticum]|uniref:shikimate dehydrogenase family protein n=1 Tax=Microbacterium esteraromaticum TaxID=57043 RepID=UPI002367686D|nr:shikimate dehydrogenase [Microbacterium esteraromaticum]WDH77452.1 shikimate dehydrogenase [Microbacterium esteraromaticum]